MSENAYEKFRLSLTMNLCKVLSADQLAAALEAVDVTMDEYEITRKRMELITADGVPEVVKIYIAAKHISHCSTGTLKQYRFRLNHFFNTVRKSYMDITANDIRLYLHYCKEHGAGDHYCDTIRIILGGFFRWLVENDYLLKSPCVKVEKIKYQAKTREALTPVQLEELRWSAASVREKAMIDMFYSSGIRASECAAARLSDIDWLNRSIRIRHGKGDKERTVFFNAEAEVSLKKYLATRQDDTDAIFVSMRKPHGALGVRGIEKIINDAAARADQHVFPHRLRHTFATDGLNRGIPLHVLQQLMGHAKPETTLIYAKQLQSTIQMEHQRIYA